MHRTRLPLPLLAVLVAACGGAPAPRVVAPATPAPAVAPATPAPVVATPIACGPAVDHLMDVMTKVGDQATSKAVLAKVRDAYRRHCETDGWSAELRACMAQAATRQDAEGCPRFLTASQRDALVPEVLRLLSEADAARPDGGGTSNLAPPPPPPDVEGRQKGTVGKEERKKAATRRRAAEEPPGATANPCDGGEVTKDVGF